MNENILTWQNINPPKDIHHFLMGLKLFVPLLQDLPNIVFFVKDINARYVFANQTLLHRLQLSSLEDIVGRTSEEIFQSEWGQRYTDQDKEVIGTCKAIDQRLELHIYTSGELGWCITNKIPFCDQNGNVIALVGVSIDVDTNHTNNVELNQKMMLIDDYIKKHIGIPFKMQELESISGLSIAQIERSFKRIFQLTPSQYIQKVRIEHAIKLLKGDHSITDISLQCGYSDHSAFTRQFKQIIGISPSVFKKKLFTSSY